MDLVMPRANSYRPFLTQNGKFVQSDHLSRIPQ